MSPKVFIQVQQDVLPIAQTPPWLVSKQNFYLINLCWAVVILMLELFLLLFEPESNIDYG